MIRKFIAAFMIIFFSATTAFAAEIDEIVIRETGSGQAPKNFDPKDSFAKTFARQAARMDALRLLAEGIGITYVEAHFDPKKNIDRVRTKLVHDSKVFKLLEKNARQIGEAKFYFDDKGKLTCEVTMELIIPADWNPTPTISTK